MFDNFNEKLIAYFVLLSGISISAVAMFYSVSGMVAIYPTAVVPIVVMGISIEVGKIAMTLWLKQNWNAPWQYKITMIPAVIVLMIITSGGVFGFLSKAHSDQSLVSGDAQSKVQLIDDKIFTVKENITTQRENISAARAALNQLDSQVNARLDRGTDELSAERAVQIRRNQRTERANLNKDIVAAQTEIEKLNEQLAQLNNEKAPLASELRKVEAEVGPVKYIAALIYGDNPDSNLLERAVRWVTLMIVLVLDPVAILLLLASQYSFQTIRLKNQPQQLVEKEDNLIVDKEDVETPIEEITTATSEITASTSTSVSVITTSFEIVSLNETIEIKESIREPIKALPVEQVEDILSVEDILKHPPIQEEINFEENIVSETEILKLEDEIVVSVGEEVITTPLPTSADSEEPADSRSLVNIEPTEYVQNEEQKESNLWSSTLASSTLTQEEYLDKVRKLKGLQ
jgi:hypothetical protein